MNPIETTFISGSGVIANKRKQKSVKLQKKVASLLMARMLRALRIITII